MKNIDFNTYVTNIIALSRSVVIKFEAIAKLDNNLLTSYGYQVSSDKRTWRYYLNLNGEYHPTDTVMTVKSLDTNEIITFNKTNLIRHVATARAYASGGYLYNQLVGTFPGQRDLINGILNPIDLDFAIESSDYKILQYDTGYVERYEDHLIADLQAWIDSFTYQHFNNEYFVTDNLMLPIAIASLYGLMPAAILNIRETAIGTNRAHSFHIWSRINSYGDFTQYKQILTTEQALWLYRNIDWVVKNAGKNYVLKELIQHLLTVRGIPIADFSLLFGTTNQLTNITPELTFKRNPLNLGKEQSASETYYTSEQIILMENGLAPDNNILSDIYLKDLNYKGKYGLQSNVPIKLLESSMEDFTNRHDVVMMVLLRDEWTYLAKHGIYNSVIDVSLASSGIEYRLTPSDAMLLWVYLTMTVRGEDTTYIPGIYYQDVAKLTPPTVDDLSLLGDKKYLTNDILTTITSLTPNQNGIISSAAFYSTVSEIYENHWKHKKLYSKFGDFRQQAEIRNACSAMYERGIVQLTTYKTFKEWFEAKEINLGNLTKESMADLAWTIYQRATGFDLYGENSLRYTQKALIDLMMTLSSYTIQTYVDIDDGFVAVESGYNIDISNNADTNQLLPNENIFFCPTDLHLFPYHSLVKEFDEEIKATDTSEFNAKLYNNNTLLVSDGVILKPNTESSCIGIGYLPTDFTLLTTEQ